MRQPLSNIASKLNVDAVRGRDGAAARAAESGLRRSWSRRNGKALWQRAMRAI